MANTREIQSRMKSIEDTMKITNAMYMISSTKAAPGKEGAGGYRAVFLYPSGHAGADHPAFAGGSA